MPRRSREDEIIASLRGRILSGAAQLALERRSIIELTPGQIKSMLELDTYDVDAVKEAAGLAIRRKIIRVSKDGVSVGVDSVSDVKKVFEFWIQTCKLGSARYKLTQLRAGKINGRLNDGFTVDDLKLACAGIMRSEFHCGINDRGTIYTDIKHVFKDAEAVDRFKRLGSGATAADAVYEEARRDARQRRANVNRES